MSGMEEAFSPVLALHISSYNISVQSWNLRACLTEEGQLKSSQSSWSPLNCLFTLCGITTVPLPQTPPTQLACRQLGQRAVPLNSRARWLMGVKCFLPQRVPRIQKSRPVSHTHPPVNRLTLKNSQKMKAMPRGSCRFIVSASAVTNPSGGACGGPQVPVKAGPVHWAQGALRQDVAADDIPMSLLTPQLIHSLSPAVEGFKSGIETCNLVKEFVTLKTKAPSEQTSFWSESFSGSFWVFSVFMVWIIWIQRDFARSRTNQWCDTWRSCLKKLEESELWSPRDLGSNSLVCLLID